MNRRLRYIKGVMAAPKIGPTPSRKPLDERRLLDLMNPFLVREDCECLPRFYTGLPSIPHPAPPASSIRSATLASVEERIARRRALGGEIVWYHGDEE